MTTQKPAPKNGAKAIVAFFILAFFAIIYLAMQPKYSKDIPKEDTESKPTSPFIDSLYSDTWEDVGSIPDSILSHLSQHNIPCGEIYVKESNEHEGSYLCACRTDVNETWAFYQVWTLEPDVIPVAYYKVHHKPQSK